MTIITRGKWVAVLLAVLLCSLPEPSSAKDSLTLWVHPYLPATELVKKFTPLTEHLSEQLGISLSMRVSNSYQAHIEQTGKDYADIAYLGPASYVKVVEIYGAKPILGRQEVRGRPVFYGMIIVREDSPLQSVEEISGKSFAFGNPDSTMSHRVPRFMLREKGVTVDRLSRFEFLGSHHDIALAVLGGYFDAGGIKEEVFYEYQPRGLRMLAKSPPISEHLFVARSTLSGEMVTSLQRLLSDLADDQEGREILSSIKREVTAIVPAVDKDYDLLRSILKEEKE